MIVMVEILARWDIVKKGATATITYSNLERDIRFECGRCEYHLELLKVYVAEEGDEGDAVFQDGALVGVLTGGRVIGVA